MIGIGVTGTDTGAGKTVVACAIAAAFAERGVRVGVMKPFETGIAPDNPEGDAHALAAASGSLDDMARIRPYVFPAPLAPMVASRAAGGEAIELARVDRSFSAISDARDIVIVEGAGGLLVPITPETSFLALFSRWKLGLVIVAPNRLGVLNHALLTAWTARSSNVRISAIVLRAMGPVDPDPSAASNGVVLSELLPWVPVLRFPWIQDVRDLGMLARAAEQSGLVSAIAPSIEAQE